MHEGYHTYWGWWPVASASNSASGVRIADANPIVVRQCQLDQCHTSNPLGWWVDTLCTCQLLQLWNLVMSGSWSLILVLTTSLTRRGHFLRALLPGLCHGGHKLLLDKPHNGPGEVTSVCPKSGSCPEYRVPTWDDWISSEKMQMCCQYMLYAAAHPVSKRNMLFSLDKKVPNLTATWVPGTLRPAKGGANEFLSIRTG